MSGAGATYLFAQSAGQITDHIYTANKTVDGKQENQRAKLEEQAFVGGYWLGLA
jgi:hypothetical protein